MKNCSFGINNDKLIDLVLSGKKRATSSLYKKDNLPIIGEESIIHFDNEKDAYIVKTIDYKIMKFKDMTEEDAALDGEGDLPLIETKDCPTQMFDQSEQTTVTKMERRIFDLDITKLKNNCCINTPSSLYLNFFEHLSYGHMGLKGIYSDIWFDKLLREYIKWLECETFITISTLGTGARNKERILKKELIKRI